MANVREYKVGPRNSTVNGDPGHYYVWSIFCWDGSAIHVDDCGRPGHPKETMKAPLPWVDGSPTVGGCQYLHVPYDWEEDCKIYRIRPNDSMYPGRIYRGHLIQRQTVIQKADGWYWVLEK